MKTCNYLAGCMMFIIKNQCLIRLKIIQKSIWQTCNCDWHLFENMHTVKKCWWPKIGRNEAKKGLKGGDLEGEQLIQQWGDHSLGVCCSRSVAFAHCHILSLDMVIEIAWRVHSVGAKTTFEPKRWSMRPCGQEGGGSFRYYLRPSSPTYLPPMRTLRKTLARGILLSKVQNGGDTGGWLLG